MSPLRFLYWKGQKGIARKRSVLATYFPNAPSFRVYINPENLGKFYQHYAAS